MPVPNSQDILPFARDARHAARLAGDIILEYHQDRAHGLVVDNKGAADYVTEVDRRAEEAIKDYLSAKNSDHRFLAEESSRDRSGGFRWIIDPLDGTTNFIHAYPMFAVSIALELDGDLILGLILDVLRDETFLATKGGGAFCNDKPIRVSPLTDPKRALVATGFPFRGRDKIDMYLAGFKAVFLEVSGIRRAGSAALDLAHLACGRLDGFFELGLSPWDVAAGALLIREAGGLITDLEGHDEGVYGGDIIGGNPAVHTMILGTLQEIWVK